MNTEKQIAGEWTPWAGGECPVDPSVLVLVSLRDSATERRRAGALRWRHHGSPDDIIAYCLITPYVAQPWRAEHGQEFWYVTTGAKSKRWTERFDDFCNRAYEAGNYYQTEELSDQACVRVRAAYKGEAV